MKRTVSILIAASAATLFSSMIAPQAMADDAGALVGCDADNLGVDEFNNRVGFVPPELRDEEYLVGGLTTSRGVAYLLCGDGVSTGAVHIQLKHNVTNWVETQTCMTNTIGRANREIPQVGRTRFEFDFPGGMAVAAVQEGSNRIETAFTQDGRSESWSACAAV